MDPVIVIKRQLRELLHSMRDEGLIDHMYEELQAAQDHEDPLFVADTILSFCRKLEEYLPTLGLYIDRYINDERKMAILMSDIKGSIQVVGASKVLDACLELRTAVEEKDRVRCMQSIERMKYEFQFVRGRFEAIAEHQIRIHAILMERRRQSQGRFPAASSSDHRKL